MKSFNKYNNYISLKGLEEKLIERFENLDGKQINECCGCCCEPTCGCGDAKCCDTYSTVFIKFYSEYEVINKLNSCAKVQDLFDIHRQFNNKNFIYGGPSPADAEIPLYFKEPCEYNLPSINNDGKLISIPKGTEHNGKLYNFINSLLKKYKMTYPIVITKSDTSIQLFFIKGTGTNGKECSIKNSLIEVAELLEELEDLEEITWTQVLDVSIDNLDDVYTFVITCTIDINKFQ